MSKPKGCTCGNKGRCGYCPSVAANAAREGSAARPRHFAGKVRPGTKEWAK